MAKLQQTTAFKSWIALWALVSYALVLVHLAIPHWEESRFQLDGTLTATQVMAYSNASGDMLSDCWVCNHVALYQTALDLSPFKTPAYLQHVGFDGMLQHWLPSPILCRGSRAPPSLV